MIPSRIPGFVYIITNHNHSQLSVGVTTDPVLILHRREKSLLSVFLGRRNPLNKLVYYEKWSTLRSAIERERQIKQSSRIKTENVDSGHQSAMA
jgi:putative endonuclease